MLDAAAPRIEAASALPADVLDALHDAQLFRMLLPRSLGGAELDLATFFQVILAIAEGDAEKAEALARRHVEEASTSLRRVLREQEQKAAAVGADKAAAALVIR